MRLVGHRGGRGFGEDNTVRAMEQAVAAGVGMIEVDVRRTMDGELVLCHNSRIGRQQVKKMTLERLREIMPERPTLQQVLESLAGWTTFNLEIKDAPAGAVVEMIQAYSSENDTLVSSFNRPYMKKFKQEYPRLRTGLLNRVPYSRERKLDAALEIGADVFLPHYSSIDREMIERAHEQGLEVYAWTVNRDEDVFRLNRWGIDGIITDRYLEIESLLRERGE